MVDTPEELEAFKLAINTKTIKALGYDAMVDTLEANDTYPPEIITKLRNQRVTFRPKYELRVAEVLATKNFSAVLDFVRNTIDTEIVND